MSRWSATDLAQRLAENPALRVDRNPLTNAPPKVSKYRAVKTEADGITFDSKREEKRYQELKLMQRAGDIQNLTLQPKYSIIVEGQRICDYKADFSYRTKQGESVVEDCKGVRTPVYRLKKKLVRALFGIEILET